jgi:hypothetical protein
MAGGTIDLDEIAMPEILDPRQVKGLHSGLCSRNVLGVSVDLVNRDRNGASIPPGELAIGLRYVHSPDWVRSVSLLF